MNLANYDTIIFDLDFTVWDGCEPEFWAKKLKEDALMVGDKIIDSDNKYIELQKGVRTVLAHLHSSKKNVGFITRGGLLDTAHDEQPPVKCLKSFGIYDYFNHQKSVLYMTDLKSEHIQRLGNTIYIDDNNKDLGDIRDSHPDIHLLNRNEFKNWLDLI